MTDNGLAALAAALDQVIDGGFYYRDLYKTRPAEDAAAILGERGVFQCADTRPRSDLAAASDLLCKYIDQTAEQAATIATLRAALDGRDNLIRLVLMRHHESEADIETCDVCRAARAALVAAREVTP